MLRRVLLAFGLLTGLSAAAWAGPMIGLDDPCPVGTSETAISLGSLITIQSGGGVTCFFNGDPTHYITDLTVEAANVGTISATILSSIQCQALSGPGPVNPTQGNFFQNCAINYDGNNLFFHFTTTNTTPDLETDPFDNELGATEQEGIPTAGTNCDGNAECLSKGHFLFTLNDGFTETNICNESCTQLGSWNEIFPNGGGSLITEELNGARLPEPTTLLPLAMSLLLAGGFSQRFLRRRRG